VNRRCLSLVGSLAAPLVVSLVVAQLAASVVASLAALLAAQPAASVVASLQIGWAVQHWCTSLVILLWAADSAVLQSRIQFPSDCHSVESSLVGRLVVSAHFVRFVVAEKCVDCLKEGGASRLVDGLIVEEGACLGKVGLRWRDGFYHYEKLIDLLVSLASHFTCQTPITTAESTQSCECCSAEQRDKQKRFVEAKGRGIENVTIPTREGRD
jgi:hypothetical protein